MDINQAFESLRTLFRDYYYGNPEWVDQKNAHVLRNKACQIIGIYAETNPPQSIPLERQSLSHWGIQNV